MLSVRVGLSFVQAIAAGGTDSVDELLTMGESASAGRVEDLMA